MSNGQNPRGVIAQDVPTSLKAVIEADAAAIVAVGVAPVHSVPGYKWVAGGYSSVVNRPVLCEIGSDFSTQLGQSSNWETYDLMELYDACFVESTASPLICINVFDPFVDNTPTTITEAPVVNLEVAIPDEVIFASLVVSGTGGVVYVESVDFSFAYNDATLQAATLSIFSTSPMAQETQVKLVFAVPNFTAITVDTIIGGVDVNGNYLGMENLEKVYTVTDIVPGTLVFPKYEMNPEAMAAGDARVESISNGRFRAFCCGGIDTTTVRKYEDILVYKNTNNFVSPFQGAGWPAFNLGTKKYHFSTIFAVAMINTAAQYGNIPYVSPSNKSIPITGTCLWDGTPVDMDLAQTDAIEQWGIMSAVNANGWRLIGDYTCAYPFDTDVHNFWLNERYMFNWLGNSLSLTLAQVIDLAGNQTTLASIGCTIISFGNHLIAVGAANTFSVSWIPGENPASNIVAGKYTYHVKWTPPTPIRTLYLLLEYSIPDLTAWISSLNISGGGS
jgi:phage tail sheath protein FI